MVIDNDAVLEGSLDAGDLFYHDSPEEAVIKVDSKDYLMKQILNLPFTESQVILMKYYQNLKLNDIAQLMDISRSSVKRYLASGQERLAKILHQD